MSRVGVLPSYWEESDVERVGRATTIESLSEVALRVLARMSRRSKPIVQVCGPISTGGAGSPEANLRRFQRAINILRDHGLLVFDQLPFQEAMFQIIQRTTLPGNYCWAILEDFYGVIFASGHITHTFFVSDWGSSTGASWERQTVPKFNIRVEDFLEEWFLIC